MDKDFTEILNAPTTLELRTAGYGFKAIIKDDGKSNVQVSVETNIDKDLLIDAVEVGKICLNWTKEAIKNGGNYEV